MKLRLVILALIGLVSLTCGGSAGPAPAHTWVPTGVEPTSAGNLLTPAPTVIPTQGEVLRSHDGLNLLVVVRGQLQLRRPGWTDFYPAGFGAVLRQGDLLMIDESGEALVLCDGLTTWAVPPGVPAGLSNGCPPPPEPALIRGGSYVGSARSPDKSTPYVISPRMTRILTDRPRLRWNAVENGSPYKVQIHEDQVYWQTEAKESGLEYPGQPALEPGKTYVLIVEANNGASSLDEGAPGVGFKLLTESDAAQARKAKAQLEKLNLPQQAETFSLAQLYLGHGLAAEAIEMLEALAEQGVQAAAVYRVLGDLFQGIGLRRLAEPQYRQAIKLAELAGDLEGQALAKAGLAEAILVLGNQEEAIELLSQSRTVYESLGDLEGVEAMEARLQELKQ